MNIKEMAQISLLLAIGFILRLIVPGYGAGMKPDLMLAMLFIIILLKRDFRSAIVAGSVAGIIAALTTTFPAGQIPNLVDKVLTSILIYFIVKILADRIPMYLTAGFIGAVGTVFSGAMFLTVALNLVGLPAPFTILFTTVVLPAAVLNTIGILVLYPIVVYSKNIVEGGRPQGVTK